MRKDRLRVLAKYLKTVPEKHFDIDIIAEEDGGKIINGAIREVGCGTAACAMGWIPSIPEFRKLGARLIFQPYGTCFRYRDRDGDYSSAAALFRISHDQSHHLFNPDSYDKSPTPMDVVKRIEEMIA